jgi:hypothetical protein
MESTFTSVKELKRQAMRMGMFILSTYLERRADGKELCFTITVREDLNGKATFDIHPMDFPLIIGGDYHICSSCGYVVHDSIFEKHLGECQPKYLFGNKPS